MSLVLYDINGKRVDHDAVHSNWRAQRNYLDRVFLTDSESTVPRNEIQIINKLLQKYENPPDIEIGKEISNLAARRLKSKSSRKTKKKLVKCFTEISPKQSTELLNSNLDFQQKSSNGKELSSSATEKVIGNPLDQISGGKSSGETPKKSTFALKFAVADFSKKLLDNEGMNISTFSEDNEEQPDLTSTSNFVSDYSQKYSMKILTPISKLIRAIKTINLLLKATTTSAEQTKKNEKKYLTFTDIQSDMESKTRISALKDLTFNVSDFRALKEKTLNIEAAKILKTHKSLRTPHQIRSVVLALTETVEAFSEFPISMQEALVCHGWYEKYNPKQVIIRQGHAAQNFYFIISGKTMVSVARKNNSSGESYGETVAFLKKGNSFGELALMYGGKRSASVICINNVELLSVTREDFIEIFMNLATNTEPEHIKFLRNVTILEGWPIDALPYDDPRICLFTYFRRGTVLCRDSSNLEWIYIICTGSCKVIKGLKQSPGKLYKLRYNPLKIEGLVKQNDKNDNGSKMIYIQLNVLNSKDIFGLESVAFELLGDKSSVTLVSDGAECVAINKSFFCQNMPESYLRKLRYEIQPFPEEQVLAEKFQNFSDWSSFQKEYTTNFLCGRHSSLR